jgi:hypothetical protein
VRRILTVLLSAQETGGLEGPPGWSTGLPAPASAPGAFRQRQITLDVEDGDVTDLDLEDHR